MLLWSKLIGEIDYASLFLSSLYFSFFSRKIYWLAIPLVLVLEVDNPIAVERFSVVREKVRVTLALRCPRYIVYVLYDVCVMPVCMCATWVMNARAEWSWKIVRRSYYWRQMIHCEKLWTVAFHSRDYILCPSRSFIPPSNISQSASLVPIS